jgi:hypothetical protein
MYVGQVLPNTSKPHGKGFCISSNLDAQFQDTEIASTKVFGKTVKRMATVEKSLKMAQFTKECLKMVKSKERVG